MIRLLGAIKCNHSALEGELQMAQQPARETICQQTVPYTLLQNPTLGNLLLQQRRCFKATAASACRIGFSIIIAVLTKGVRVILSHPNLSICLNLCSVCPGVYVCRVAGLVPAGLHLVFVPCCVSSYVGINI